MPSEIIKVCVRIPIARKDELLALADNWRSEDPKARRQGWDARAVHQIASKKYGSLQKMFEHHHWPERGSDMMRQVQKRVSETYGNVANFIAKHDSRQIT